MSSHFLLKLDTTPPIIEIAAPRYSLIGLDTEIFIYSNEQLGSYQDIYFIDSDGTRHDMVFENRETYYYGLVNFNGFSLGISTLYVRLSDIVSNPSGIVMKTILIKEHADISISLSEIVRRVDLKVIKRRVDLKGIKRRVKILERHKIIELMESNKIIEVIESQILLEMRENKRLVKVGVIVDERV